MSTVQRPGILGVAALAALLGGLHVGRAAPKMPPRRNRAERRRGRRARGASGCGNPAGTKILRQMEAGACTLRGRVTNGEWGPDR